MLRTTPQQRYQNLMYREAQAANRRLEAIQRALAVKEKENGDDCD